MRRKAPFHSGVGERRWRERHHHQTRLPDLEAEGFIETVQGKGCFVASGNHEMLREEQLRAASRECWRRLLLRPLTWEFRV